VKVQRVWFPDTNHLSWIVLGDDFLPVKPILVFLKFMEDLGRSPNTVRATAHHLKLFWEYLRDERLDWKDVDIAHLAAFISWLRNPRPSMRSLKVYKAERTDATIDQILTAIHVFYEFHIRLKSVPDLPLYSFVTMPHRRYKPVLYGMVRTKHVQTRNVKVKRGENLIKTLTSEQVQAIFNACIHVRDKFLLALLYETGMRIGQALGLRHSDISIEDGKIHIVPRDDNVNNARTKSRTSYTIPANTSLLQLYTDYLTDDLNALEADYLPDYVFVNLWDGEIGRPMTYESVISLFRRLHKKTGIRVTPHMLRHTRATEWIRDDKLPLPTVSRLLTHTSIQTTHDIYVHLTPEDLKRELEDAEKRKGRDDIEE
jgi:integrase/recombinase XerD